MSSYILDSSAVLAFLNQEPGAKTIEGYLSNSMISSVNLAEVVGKLTDIDMPENNIKAVIDNLYLRVVDFNENIAFLTGLLKNKTRSKGLSLGDRACLATGIMNKLPVITSDKVWNSLDLQVEIIVFR